MWAPCGFVMAVVLAFPVLAQAQIISLKAPKERITGRADPIVLTGEVSGLSLGSDKALIFTTTVGQVRKVTWQGNDQFTAEYWPPSQPFPVMTIVAASLYSPAGTVHGVLRLPLPGKATLGVDAPEGSDVSVTFGGLTLGPKRADASGRVVFHVLDMNPDVRFYDVLIERLGGRLSRFSKPVEVPKWQSMLIGPVPPKSTWVRQRSVIVTGSTPQGRPVPSDAIACRIGRTKRGRSLKRVAEMPGWAEFVLPAKQATTVQCRYGKATVTGTLKPADGLALSRIVIAGPDRFVSGGKPVAIQWRGFDVSGFELPVPKDAKVVATMGAQALTLTPQNGGGATLEIPDHFGVAQEVVVQVQQGPLTSRHTIALAPGEPVSLRTIEGLKMPADGRRTERFSAEALDAAGNTVSVPLAVRAELGEVAAEDTGEFVYRAPELRQSAQDTIVVTGVGEGQTITVALWAPVHWSAWVGGGAVRTFRGALVPVGRLGFGVTAPRFAFGVVADGGVGAQESTAALGDGSEVGVTRRFAVGRVAALIDARWPVGARLAFRAGLGLGAEWWGSRTELSGQAAGDQPASDTTNLTGLALVRTQADLSLGAVELFLGAEAAVAPGLSGIAPRQSLTAVGGLRFLWAL